uniref:Holocytochrome c-type synthase n=1 Tax=Glossina austeni TaxID=7395 RepID=A0A1A9UQV4_GLOAU
MPISENKFEFNMCKRKRKEQQIGQQESTKTNVVIVQVSIHYNNSLLSNSASFSNHLNETLSECPVRHENSDVNPMNMMPPANQKPAPDQSFPVSTERQTSSIPKATEDALLNSGDIPVKRSFGILCYVKDGDGKMMATYITNAAISSSVTGVDIYSFSITNMKNTIRFRWETSLNSTACYNLNSEKKQPEFLQKEEKSKRHGTLKFRPEGRVH